MKVLGIAGSLRSGSLNRELLRRALAAAPAGIEVETWDGLRDVPPDDQDEEDSEPEAVASLRQAISSADAVLIVTPEYNGSIPGVLKNAIDWASRPNVLTGCFRNKPVAVISASDGMFGAMWAGAELKKVMGLGGRPRRRRRARASEGPPPTRRGRPRARRDPARRGGAAGGRGAAGRRHPRRGPPPPPTILAPPGPHRLAAQVTALSRP